MNWFYSILIAIMILIITTWLASLCIKIENKLLFPVFGIIMILGIIGITALLIYGIVF